MGELAVKPSKTHRNFILLDWNVQKLNVFHHFWAGCSSGLLYLGCPRAPYQTMTNGSRATSGKDATASKNAAKPVPPSSLYSPGTPGALVYPVPRAVFGTTGPGNINVSKSDTVYSRNSHVKVAKDVNVAEDVKVA